jgi:hypothetical protein
LPHLSPRNSAATARPGLETKFAMKEFMPYYDYLSFLLWSSLTAVIALFILLAVIDFVTVRYNEFNEPRKKRSK